MNPISQMIARILSKKFVIDVKSLVIVWGQFIS